MIVVEPFANHPFLEGGCCDTALCLPNKNKFDTDDSVVLQT